MRSLVRASAMVAAATSCFCAAFVACGLDENGLLGDASVPDVATPDVVVIDSPPDVIVDNYVPPTCANLDASCLGAPIPAGWIPIGLVANPTTVCPGDGGDFQQLDWVTNPMLQAGACNCAGCAITGGSYSCAGQVTVMTGSNGCDGGTVDTFTAGPHCTTSVTSTGNNQVSGTQPAVTGSPTCKGNTNAAAASTTPVRTCKPLQCTTDYCGLANSGYSLCILYNGDAGCPTGFSAALPTGNSTPGKLDVKANATATCTGNCTCQVNTPPASCSAQLRMFGSNDCSSDAGDAGYLGSIAAGACTAVNSSALQSILYVPGNPPDASCTPTGTGSGTAGLKAPVSVCCK